MKNQSSDATLTGFAALIGLDWGHGAHAIALEISGANTETSTLEHSAENLHQWLDQLEKRCGGRPVAVAIEASKGAAVYALLERPWITVYPIHPATSTRTRAAFRPSGAKDDTPDALVLLSLLQHHRDRLRPLQLDDEATRTLARLVEARRKAVDRRTLLSNQLQSTLRDYFPQALELVGDNLAAPLALDFLERWPRLTDVQAARNATLKSFYQRHNVRRPELIESRVQRIRSARLLTRDAAVTEVAVRTVRLLVAELRVLQEHIAAFETAIAQAFAAHPEKNLFRELPGAGAVLAPRLLVAFGTLRDRFADAGAMQRYFGVAPVTEKSGGRVWVHWRWNAPVFVRQTLVEWAGQTVVYCPWAKAYYEQQRGKRVGHWAILRALAFKWLRILWRCWQKSEAYEEEKYLRQLEQRRSPIAALARQFAKQMAS
ncbi:IS110 family transposase [Pedosphaera parvula]|uniref:Transposase IS111A/IS1328/IS1533 n=1 Tax=Pedosphaera parvula (strain Ellin514) TaxID=320771 RepID=B9XDD3_PEDPL|nr:IS110 family transposase [Pedosphaera parvula]EEF57846.1 transposase IS111A/IS1328/IS1533 [Pedosphaera parvula Ellin514]EEF62079.1 transposase IS111A/IS1328/IS1533 [Pedosphaera parvula Ellin514]